MPLCNKTLTLRGGYLGELPEPGARIEDGEPTIFDAMESGRVLLLTDNSDTRWEALTFANGYTNDHGGGIRIANSVALFEHCTIRDHQLAGGEKRGAGLYTAGAGSVVTLDHCVLRGNRTVGAGTKYGGAVCQDSGTLTLRHCIISGNFATYYAAGYLAGTVTLFNCLIRNNQSNGGGLSARGTIRIENCTVVDNTPNGIERIGGTVLVTNSIVWYNQNNIVGSPVTVTHSAVDQDGLVGTTVYRDDPMFVNGYYLADASPYLNAGGQTAADLGLDTRYAQTNQTDSGMVALGYHAPTAFSISFPDLYVALGGDNRQPGNDAGVPLATISHALAIAEPGARIHLAAGQYTTDSGEAFPLVMRDGPVVIQGTNANETVIDAGGEMAQGRVVDGLDLAYGSGLRNITIMGGRLQTHSANGAGLCFQNSHVDLIDVVVRENRIFGGENWGGGIYGYGGTLALQNCRVEFNQRAGHTVYGVGLAQKMGTLLMDRCIVNGNRGNYVGGIRLWDVKAFMRSSLIVSNSAPGRYGGMLITSGSVYMENITVTDNTTCGVSGPGTIINSILWNNGLDVEGALEISYSCISNGTYSDQGYNIAENPRFQNAAAGNYRLIRNESTAMTSPCIDAGSNAAWMTGAFDLDGRPRIMRGDTTAAVSRVDMGAYEVSPLAGTILVLR